MHNCEHYLVRGDRFATAFGEDKDRLPYRHSVPNRSNRRDHLNKIYVGGKGKAHVRGVCFDFDETCSWMRSVKVILQRKDVLHSRICLDKDAGRQGWK